MFPPPAAPMPDPEQPPKAKPRNRSYWIRSGLYSLLERFSLQVFGLGTLIILIAPGHLAPEAFGTWVLYLMVASFLEVGRNGLIQNGLVKFLTTVEGLDYRRILSASSAINLALTVVTGVSLWFAAPAIGRLLNAPEALPPLLRIYVFTNVALAPFAQSNFVQQANLRFQGIFLSNFIRGGSFFGFVAWTWLSGREFDLGHLAWAQFGAAAAASLIATGYALPNLRFSTRLELARVRQLLRFGVFTFGTSLSTMLYKMIDRFMLGALLTPAAVALMDPAIRITNIMEIPIYAMAAVLYPQSARRIEKEGRYAVKLLYEKSVGATLAIVLPISVAVLLFPEFLVRIVTAGNPEYLGAVPILQVTILYTLFVPYSRQFGIVLDSIGRPGWSFGFVLTGALLNVVSNYLFIETFGYGVIGAAYGTLTTLALKFVAQQVILYRVLHVQTHKPLIYAWSFAGEGLRFARGFVKDPAGTLNRFRA